MRIVCQSALLALALAGTAFGDTIELSRDADVVLHGPWQGGRTGWAFATGDFDGDGRADLAIGSPGATATIESEARVGVVKILFGGPDFEEQAKNGLLNIPHRIRGERASQGVGASLAAGDFDGDGKSDLLIGCALTTEGDTTVAGGGGAYLVFGRERSAFSFETTLPAGADIVFLPSEAGIALGEGVAMGDFDGDGRDDLAIGASRRNGPENSRPAAGAVEIVFGRERKKLAGRVPIGKASDLTIHGPERDDELGRCLAFIDWNADRREDLAIGAMFADGPFNTRTDPGEAHLLLGRERKAFGKDVKKRGIDLQSPGASMPLFGAWARGSTGFPVGGGDLDGDGFGDIVISSSLAPDAGPRIQSGVVDVIFGGFVLPEAIDLDGPAEFRILGERHFDHLGECTLVHDMNGDERGELFVASPFADPLEPTGMPRLQAGSIGVMMGRPKAQYPDTLDLTTAAFDHVIIGADEEDHVAGALCALDIDGDGTQDLVIGAPAARGRDNIQHQAGEVYFLLGRSRSW